MSRCYLQGNSKHGKGHRDSISRVSKSLGGGVTQLEIGILLDNFKNDILNSISSKFDAIKINLNKQYEIELSLTIFCLRCQKKHPLREFPLNTVENFIVNMDQDIRNPWYWNQPRVLLFYVEKDAIEYYIRIHRRWVFDCTFLFYSCLCPP